MLFLARFFIRGYQIVLSPALSFLAGPGGGCRFEPTCSVYFLQALETHGFWRGTWLGLCRLGRCNPWGGRGPDPVPPRECGRGLCAPTGAAIAAQRPLPHCE